jgi:hypothetical protein
MTLDEAVVYAKDPDSPDADSLQVHDLRDAAMGSKREQEQFEALAHICETCGKPITEDEP